MSRAPEGYHDAEIYLQVKPKFTQLYSSVKGGYVDAIASITVVNMTQTRPRKPAGGTITAKVTLRIPDAALLPFAPEAVITVPEGLVITNPIEVVADDANAQED
jgi:hypothetical protein